MPDMTELRERTAKLPNGRLILESGWQLAGFGQHRDSDSLEESNYAVAMQTLLEASGMTWRDVGYLGQPWDGDDTTAPVSVAHFGHWAVGWVDELMVRIDRPDMLAVCQQMLDRIENYPVLDEDHWVQHEFESNHPNGECYCDDPECSLKPDEDDND